MSLWLTSKCALIGAVRSVRGGRQLTSVTVVYSYPLFWAVMALWEKPEKLAEMENL